MYKRPFSIYMFIYVLFDVLYVHKTPFSFLVFYVCINSFFVLGVLYVYKLPFLFLVFYMCRNHLFRFCCFNNVSTTFVVSGVLYVY